MVTKRKLLTDTCESNIKLYKSIGSSYSAISLIPTDYLFFLSLGLSNNSIPDNFFGASSSIDVYYRPGEGRLNNSHVVGQGSGAWCSGSDDKAPYLQVNLGSVRKVTHVSTQGHPVLHKWVTLFRLSYSLNGVIWTKLDKVNVIFSY